MICSHVRILPSVWITLYCPALWTLLSSIDFHMFLRSRLNLDAIIPKRPSLTSKTRLGVLKCPELSLIIALTTLHLIVYPSPYIHSFIFAPLKSNYLTLPDSKYISENSCWIDEWMMRVWVNESLQHFLEN